MTMSLKEKEQTRIDVSDMAFVIKASYDAYLSEGFTEEQSLELCKCHIAAIETEVTREEADAVLLAAGLQ